MMNKDIAKQVESRLDELSNPLSAEGTRELVRENRTLRWKFKSICKQNGKQGETIHQLRGEIALLRAHGGMPVGDYLRLLRQKQDLEAEVRVLREKLDAAEGATPVPYTVVTDTTEYHDTPTRDQDA